MSTRAKIYLSGIILITAIVYVTACRGAGSWLVKKDESVHADAMVILISSISDRVMQAADLYQQGLADKVIIVEESMGPYSELKARGVDIISNTTQTFNAIVSLGIPPDSITILPGNARSIQQEAMIIREYLERRPNIDTILFNGFICSSYPQGIDDL